MVKGPDLNLLPIAFALYDERNVSRAARALGMSQPAVSMALRRLREAFGDPLFVRVPGGIAPTPRAHTLLRRARPLVNRLHETLSREDAFDPATTTTTFTIALSDVGELAFLPRILSALRGAAPNCAIRSASVPAAQLAHDLERGEIDLAIGYFPPLSSRNFRQRRLHRQQFACLLRAQHPRWAPRLTVRDYLALEHVAVRLEGRSQEVLERFLERKHLRREVVVVTAHFLPIPFIVARSDLVATIPRAVALHFASMIPQLGVAALPFDVAGFELKQHWHRRFDNEPRHRWLRERLMAAFRDERATAMPPPASAMISYSSVE
jgi:DNA-binding transcriptional LysR family regulator